MMLVDIILERMKGVEPSYSAWEADIIAVILHSHYYCNLQPPLSTLSSQGVTLLYFNPNLTLWEW